MALEDSTNPMQGVSGPGPYAKRTDLSYQSQSYGDGVAYDAAKSGAPLATAPKSPLFSQAPQVAAPQAPVTGLFEPTQRPNEPVTHGINVGPGAGSEALMMRKPDDSDFRMNIQAAKPILAYISDLSTTSPETRAALKELWDM